MRSGSSSGNSSSTGNGWRASAAAPLNNYEFDFGNLGLGSGGRSSLNSLRQEVSITQTQNNQQHQSRQQHSTSRIPQPNQNQKWVHRPVAASLGATSMVGDITGKSWAPLDKNQTVNSSASSSSGVVGGVGNSKSDLFSDLFSTLKPSSTPISQPKPAPTATPISKPPMNQMKNTSAAKSHSDDDFFGNFSSSSAPAPAPPPPKPQPKPQADPLDDLWRKIPPPRQSPVTVTTTTTTIKTTPAKNGGGASSSSEAFMNGLEAWEGEAAEEYHQSNEATTELEGLPPPPAGVTGSMAKEKGAEFQKQGQFADAIKWLSWSLSLLGKDDPAVLTCRASCYKEVGEYKKAVDDCCKILEMDSGDTEALLQRAFLYESMEKYKLSVQDLREVLKRDSSNRLARNTLARLAKMVD